MLRIRLQRVGRKHEPVFRIVLTESQNSTKSGKYLETLGSFDARSHERQLVDAERVKYWISQGAKPTDTMHNFLVSKKIITGKKINVLPKKSPIKKEEAAKAPEPAKEEKKEETVTEAPKAEEKKEEPVVEAPKA